MFRTDLCTRRSKQTIPKLVDLYVVASLGGVDGCKSTYRTGTNDDDLLLLRSHL